MNEIERLKTENEAMKRLLGLSSGDEAQELLDAVSVVTGISLDKMKTRDRTTDTATARAIYAYVGSRTLGLSSRRLARYIKRDGSSVRYNALLVDDMLSINAQPYKMYVERVKTILQHVQNRQEQPIDN